VKGLVLNMNGNARLEEYKAKIDEAKSAYQKEFTDFMKRRIHYSKLDEGVQEENKIRKKYYDTLDKLSAEYSDVM